MSGSMSHGEVISVTKGLECSPSKTSKSSSLPSTKGNLAKGTAKAHGKKHMHGSKMAKG
jgi:hypothetical protein